MAKSARIRATTSMSRVCLTALNLCFALVFAIVLLIGAMDWSFEHFRLDPHEGWLVSQLLSRESSHNSAIEILDIQDLGATDSGRCSCLGSGCSLPASQPATDWHRGLLESDYQYMQTSGCSIDNGSMGGVSWRHAMRNMPSYRTEVDGEMVHFIWLQNLKVSSQRLQGAISASNGTIADYWTGALKHADSRFVAGARTPVDKRVALMLVHGWPGSVLEYVPMARLLMEASAATEAESSSSSAAEAVLLVDLIIPSLPRFGLGGSAKVQTAQNDTNEAGHTGGFGQSSSTSIGSGPTHTDRTGVGAHRAAAILARLMCKLGYCTGPSRRDDGSSDADSGDDHASSPSGYMVAGGDWGGMIAPLIAQIDPCSVRMVHTALPVVLPRPTQLLRFMGAMTIDYLAGLHLPKLERSSFGELLARLSDASGLSRALFMSEEERRTMRLPAMQFMRNAFDQSAYMHQQMTRPYTLGRVLRSSPEAMHAWTEEKLMSWSGCGAALQSRWKEWMNSTAGPITWNSSIPESMPPVERFLAGGSSTGADDSGGEASRHLQQALSCFADAAAIAFGMDASSKDGLGMGVEGLAAGSLDSGDARLLSEEQASQAAAFVHAMSRIHIDGGTQGSWLEIYADTLFSSMFWGLQSSLVDVPTVILDNPGEVVARVPRRWARSRFRSLLRVTTPAHDGMGNPAGHFFAVERPRAYLDEILRTLLLDATVDSSSSGFIKKAAQRRHDACVNALPYIGHFHGTEKEEEDYTTSEPIEEMVVVDDDPEKPDHEKLELQLGNLGEVPTEGGTEEL